jgi:hypothetical protein
MSRDQEMFERHCREVLGHELNQILPIAQQKYQQAYDAEPAEHRKENKGIRAMNLHLLAELKKRGAERWRPDKDGKKPQRRHVPRQQLTQQERKSIGAKSENMPKHYQGKILKDAGLL